jgi:hypothetical protein
MKSSNNAKMCSACIGVPEGKIIGYKMFVRKKTLINNRVGEVPLAHGFEIWALNYNLVK